MEATKEMDWLLGKWKTNWYITGDFEHPQRTSREGAPIVEEITVTHGMLEYTGQPHGSVGFHGKGDSPAITRLDGSMRGELKYSLTGKVTEEGVGFVAVPDLPSSEVERLSSDVKVVLLRRNRGTNNELEGWWMQTLLGGAVYGTNNVEESITLQSFPHLPRNQPQRHVAEVAGIDGAIAVVAEDEDHAIGNFMRDVLAVPVRISVGSIHCRRLF